MTSQPSPTLYDRLGGDPALSKLMDAFYARVLADAELAPFFVDRSIEKLRTMQIEFFSAALGGPIRYTGRPLAQVHAGLGIRPRHLERFLQHLLETLEGQEIDEDDRYEIYTRINIYADEITGQTTVDG